MSGGELLLRQLDRVIHEPARLAIVSVLSACESADFLFLQRSTGLTSGNLSVQLMKLEEAGLVRVTKQFRGKKPVTSAALTAEGGAQVKRYWELMDELRRGVQTEAASEPAV